MSNFRHIEYLLKRKCFPNYLKALNFKVDLKEMSECIGMLRVLRNVVRDKNITTAFDIGCGKRPTLGVLMALEIKSINNTCNINQSIINRMNHIVVKLYTAQYISAPPTAYH